MYYSCFTIALLPQNCQVDKNNLKVKEGAYKDWTVAGFWSRFDPTAPTYVEACESSVDDLNYYLETQPCSVRLIKMR